MAPAAMSDGTIADVSNAKRLHYSYEEYLGLLAESTLKLEYCDGVIYAMAGGTVAHAALSAAAIGLLRQGLLGRCKVFGSDLKVRVEASDLATFPDVSVVCAELETSAHDAHALVNPSLLVEVTSRSTEDYDRGDKLSHYKQLPSLRAVLFISHRERRVTVVERSARGWDEREVRGGEQVTVTTPSVSIAVDELYAGVNLDPR
jgi:Uma2 family endonuclease